MATKKAEQEAALVEAEVAKMVSQAQDSFLDIMDDETELEKKKNDVLQKAKQQWLLQLKAWFSKNGPLTLKLVNEAEETWYKRMDVLVV